MDVDLEQGSPLKVNGNIRSRSTGLRLLLSFAALVIVIAGLAAAKTILVPFVFALLLAIVGSTPLRWLLRSGMPRGLAVLIVSGLFLLVGFGVGRIVGEGVQLFSSRLPEYAAKLQTLTVSLVQALEHLGIALSVPNDSQEVVKAGSAVTILGQMLRASFTAVSNVLFVLIALVFLLLEASDLHRKGAAVLNGSLDISHITKVLEDVRRYVGVKTLMSALTGICVGILNWALGVEFAFLWGFLAFLLNFIPVIGSNIAAIPPILLTFVESESVLTMVLIVGYVVVNVGISNFLEPIIMGKELGISPLVVFLSLIFWGWLWGPAGALMSVPLTIIVKILFEHSAEFRWISGLMGSATNERLRQSR